MEAEERDDPVESGALEGESGEGASDRPTTTDEPVESGGLEEETSERPG